MVRKIGEEHCGLVAAYREGLGLAAVTIVCGPTGARIVAPGAAGRDAAAENAQARWWCARAADATRLAAAARRSLRRESSRGPTPAPAAAAAGGRSDDSALSCARAAVLAAAEKFNIALQSDQDIAAEAINVAARVEAEMQKQQQRGGLKSVNKAYRSYRLEAGGRGERVLRYDQWMRKYREDLLRQIAAALRQV